MPSKADEPAWPRSAFWDFSLDLYARPGVEAACLELQDERQLDVNVVLLAAWAAATGRSLDEPVAARLRAMSEPYRKQVMQPLREARRGLATALPASLLADLAEDRRRRLKRLELDLEHLEQLALEAVLPNQPSSAAGPAALAEKADLAELFRANLERLYPDRPLPEQALQSLVRALYEMQG